MRGWQMALPLTLGFASPSAAGTVEFGVSVIISHADLDLSREPDARRLRKRVGSAIKAICAQPRQGALANPAQINCRRAAMARTKVQIDRAMTLAAMRQSFMNYNPANASER